MRKGELSPARVDREWPHQITLRANDCTGAQYTAIAEFCAGLSLCPRGHSYVEADVWMRVFCFAEKEHAERFRERFGGEPFDPARRRKGRNWTKLRPVKANRY